MVALARIAGYTFGMPIGSTRRAWISASVLAVTLGVVVGLVVFSPLRALLTSPEAIRDRVQDAGFAGPLVMVGINMLQILAAPIPGQAIDLANGYLFGWWGIGVSAVGLSLGSSLAIFLARRFGRPLVEMLITPKAEKTIRPYTRRRNYWPFFILFLLPGTPDDLLCFAIGLTSIPLSQSILIALLGRTPGVVAAVAVGATGQRMSLLSFSLWAAGVSLAFGLVLWLWPAARKLTKLEPPKV